MVQKTLSVKQGCVLAPALFCRAMDCILEPISTQNIFRLPEHDFSDLNYADDIALLDAFPANLASALDLLQTRASQLGLNVSWQKTKLQFLGDTTITDNITVRGQAVETVDDFVYLGSVQSSDVRCSCSGHYTPYRPGRICHEITSYNVASTEDPALHEAGHLPHLRPAHDSLRAETWTLLASDMTRLEALHMPCQ